MKRFAFAIIGAGSLALAGQALAQDATEDSADFTVTATTQEAISVSCAADGLRFGVLAVDPNRANAADITVEATSTGSASSDDAGVMVVSGSGPGVCTVAGENGADATAALSVTGGTWDAGTKTLSSVSLAGTGGPLAASVELSKVAAIGSEDLYIGGTVTIPADHNATGVTYTETITLTVTD